MCHLGRTTAPVRAYYRPVRKSDEPARISGATERPALSLDRVEPGCTVRVTGMPDSARQALQQEGVVIDAELTVERRVGLGGPVIVRLGRARLAIARAVARSIETGTASR
jgi:Fe2+ transport system protein FeoA